MRAPASRRTCVQARSKGFARRCKSPVREQAARWSPRRSRRQPHLWPGHRLVPSRSGRRRRRRRATWKSAGRRVVAAETGSVVSQAPAPGPEPERSSARWPRGKRGNSTCSLKCVSRVEQALNCQPCRHSPGSAESASSSSVACLKGCCGRAPARRLVQEGRSTHPSESRTAPTAAASRRHCAPCASES